MLRQASSLASRRVFAQRAMLSPLASSTKLMQPFRPSTTATQAAPDAAHYEGWVKCTETLSGDGFLQSIATVNGHAIVIDEPTSLPGGANTAPTPYDLLMAAVGSCTNVTLRLMANKRGIPVDRIQVFTKHERIYAKDCDDCDSKDGQVDVISRVIHLEGDKLTNEHKKQLLKFADLCPIHKTLTSETKIVTELDG